MWLRFRMSSLLIVFRLGVIRNVLLMLLEVIVIAVAAFIFREELIHQLGQIKIPIPQLGHR